MKREAGGAVGAKKAKWAGWLLGRLGQKQKKILLEKIGFFNLPRLWKFAQGDLGGILTQGFFFLNSSRLLKDF
jgi:hypothetical protein